ncbi:MAG: YbdK family carboxylate-amine ligase [Rhodoferax sp.]|jgi:carboxylate-amine ligase|nr:YbdK family carboxylate-amine ligase [Rhodoferax sp.]MBP9061081.1 YbdK family carboxylate-amine ligase [Rhodoferax sp.]MBP9685696.1 YbdK family carboxylate-amine ligase [Rhodoferax sp.]
MQFGKSAALTFGMELEFQIVSASTGTLAPTSLAFWEILKHREDMARYSLEATLSTIELNTSVHTDADDMAAQVMALTQTLCNIAGPMGLLIRGGGTQLTQFWNERIMAPTDRAQELTQRFGFLPKRFSTYGMHVHIGAANADSAIHMGNVLQALCPLFIAMSAASPFLQMADTGFCASRPLEPLIYPHGGPMPELENWHAFEQLAKELFSTRLATSLKDIYWDVRPKPEFGTIEVRVFDTPLSLHKAVGLAAFTRACAALALGGVLVLPASAASATAQRVSRFLACRDGLDADLFDPFARKWLPARQWLQVLVDTIIQAPVCAADLRHILALQQLCLKEQDATVMRDTWERALNQGFDVQSRDFAQSKYSRELSMRLMASANCS